jgi:amidase
MARKTSHGAISAEDRRQKRRSFLKLGAAALGAAAASCLQQAAAGPNGPDNRRDSAARRFDTDDLMDLSIADLQAAMSGGRLSSRQLVGRYLKRIHDIDVNGPRLNSLIELNPDALDISRALDEERRRSGPRGPLHGIPMVLKDNIDTGDKMQTSAGSLALVGAPAAQDATVAARLRAAGAVILGKSNLSEWANTRASYSASGWSGRGGKTLNPYYLDRSPLGSSSGSGVAVAAGLCAAAIGTETDGSIITPASANAVVGIKPTVGLTSRAGVVPISSTQDTIGPFGRTVADAAAVLGAFTGPDPRDPATNASAGRAYTDYTQFLDPNGLRGARIGIPRNTGFYGTNGYADAIGAAAIQAMTAAGAIIVDPADFPSGMDYFNDNAELVVLVYEFKRTLNAYLATRTGVPVRSMADVIAFNIANADRELQFFDQAFMELAESEAFSEAEYLDALARSARISREQGIDAVMDMYQLDALFAPTLQPAHPTDLILGDRFITYSASPSAMAGYPVVSVPAGDAFGLPVGYNFMGRAYSEPTLIKLAYAFEQLTRARRNPQFLPTVPVNDPALLGSPRRKHRSASETAEQIRRDRRDWRHVGH